MSVLGTVVILACGSAFGQAAPTTFAEGQKVEVREGDSWSKAAVLKIEGRKYQIKYEDGGQEEWVTSERMREVSSAAGAATGPATTTAAAVKPVAKAVWDIGQKVEVKWGGMWREATIQNKRGEWLLVNYTPGSVKEWAEPWRIRKVGSTEDNIGHATPNRPITSKMEAPPTEKPGEPAKPMGRASRTEAATAAAEAIKQDPAYKEASLAGTPDTVLLTGNPWQVVTDGAGETRTATHSRIELHGTKDEARTMRNVFVARGEGVAIIGQLSGRSAFDSTLRVERVNLATGGSMGTYELGSSVALVDVSPDGKSVLVRSDKIQRGSKDRLEVWSLEGEKAKRTLVFYPYADADIWKRDVSGARFVDGGHIATVGADKLVLWDVATGKGVYQAGVSAGTKLGLSPGGRYLVVEKGDMAVLVEALTGKPAGELTLEGMKGAVYGFSASGKQLAAWGNKAVRVWDLGTGKLYREFSLSFGSEGEGLWGAERSVVIPKEGYGLVDGQYLLDFEKRVLLWHYEGGSEGALAAGRVWMAKNDKVRGPELMGMETPNTEVIAAGAKVNADDLLLLKPGAKVALVVNVGGDQAERDQAIAGLKKHIDEAGLVLDDTSPIKIVATTEAGKTTERTYRAFGAPMGQGETKVNVTQQRTILRIEVDGKAAWETGTLVDAGVGMLSLKQGQTVEQAIAEQSKPNVLFLGTVRIPRYLAKPKDPAWLGSSKVGD